MQLRDRVNVMPLGSGALAGNPFPIDRHYLSDLLGFDSITPNSLLGVSDRDFVGKIRSIVEDLAAYNITRDIYQPFYSILDILFLLVEFLSWASILSSHLSRLAEDL